ncbi:MAG: VTT domain-containing protein [Actinomycetota bacterium]|nr:VTT domain-containing protein [Actinomycetota bacterium]
MPVAIGPEWLDPDTMIRGFGSLAVLGICLVVFAESGLLFGFFLPGDSLLFTAGLLTATGVIDTPLPVLCALIALSAIAGDQVGYYLGKKAGPAIFHRPDSRFFKQEYVDHAYAYFDRYGPRTIVMARFVPIVRTFAPVVAGVGRMRYRTFVTYNVVGGVLWGAGVTALGYFLGQFAFVAKHIELILIGIVVVSVLPMAAELLRARSRRRLDRYDEEHERERVSREDIGGDARTAEESSGARTLARRRGRRR